MKLRFTNHAQFRIFQRKISIEDIKKVIREPDFSRRSFGDTVLARKIINGGNLEIVYKKDSNAIIVITIYYI